MTIHATQLLATASMAAAAAFMAPAAFAQQSDGESAEQTDDSTAQSGSAQNGQSTQQPEGESGQSDDGTEVNLTRYDPAAVYEGWSANALLDEDAYNQNGEDLGEVEDIIVGPDGRIERVIVEGGGFIDIGDVHAAVPWDMVSRTGANALRVQVSGEDISEYARFPNMDDMPTAPENFRVRELIGDFVRANGRGYGTVDDVIFTDEGQIQALVVYPAYGYGYRTSPVAVPYQNDGYSPYAPYYETELGTAELDELRPFNYGELN